MELEQEQEQEQELLAIRLRRCSVLQEQAKLPPNLHLLLHLLAKALRHQALILALRIPSRVYSGVQVQEQARTLSKSPACHQ